MQLLNWFRGSWNPGVLNHLWLLQSFCLLFHDVFLWVLLLRVWHFFLPDSDKEVGSGKNIRNSDHGRSFAYYFAESYMIFLLTTLLNYYLVWSFCLLFYLIPILYDFIFTTSLDYFVFDLRTDHVFWIYLERYRSRQNRNKAASSLSMILSHVIILYNHFSFSMLTL